MNQDHFWLTDAQFAKLKPHLPTDTRGKPRVDDRRVISGIIHVIKSGGRWVDAPVYGPRKTLYNRFQRCAAKGIWSGIFDALANAGGAPTQLLIDCSAVCAHRSAAGGKKGNSTRPSADRGGRTTKIHALTDGMCRPVAFLLTGGHVADCTAGELLIDRMPPTSLLNADKGYDSDAIRRQVKQRGAFANIPPKANRKWKNCFSPYLYQDRNTIERMFCRLKDFRRIVIRCDRLATNFLAAICIAATVSYWL
ncbi:IS5 family transposase [Mesorhizobium sp. SB112]|uniref:IS5 family transposase n=1 Tax=Mesorhizobium sp. SB112 TaxID=3151853 RepID=UPI003263FED4